MTNHIKSNKIKSTSKLADYKKFQYKDLTKNIDNSDINRRKRKVMNLAELRNNALKYTEEKLEYVDTNFIQIGPNVITNDQGNHGNTISITGKITDLAIDYRNNEIIYVATRKGGLWKTIDGGLNWSPISDHEKSLSVGAIVIHPKNPNILYAGTGETDSRENYYGNGILKTVDGGNK